MVLIYSKSTIVWLIYIGEVRRIASLQVVFVTIKWHLVHDVIKRSYSIMETKAVFDKTHNVKTRALGE